MDKLPLELLTTIFNYAYPLWGPHGRTSLAALASLSRGWQHLVEKRTFYDLTVTNDDIDTFYELFAGSENRRRALRSLSFLIVLPCPSDGDCANYETAADRTMHDALVRHHVSTLLQFLSQWSAHSRLGLSIDVHSPLDFPPLGTTLAALRRRPPIRKPQDIREGRSKYSYVHLPDDLAQVPCVTSFASGGTKHLEPVSLVRLTAAFPGLERIDWLVSDPEGFLALQRPSIQGFARAISTFDPPPSCKHFHLELLSTAKWYHHGGRVPDLASGGVSLCDALRIMLGESNFSHFTYERGLIDPSFFWPQSLSENGQDCQWKSLKRLQIDFKLASLSGQWFFQDRPGHPPSEAARHAPMLPEEPGMLPPGYHDNVEDNQAAISLSESMVYPTDEDDRSVEGADFRCYPRNEVMMPLLYAMARRLIHTPSLQDFRLSTEVQGLDVWSIQYYAPGVGKWDEYLVHQEDTEDSSVKVDTPDFSRIFFHVGEWRPEEELLTMLREVGMAHHGRETRVTFLPSSYDDSDSEFWSTESWDGELSDGS
ncbi:hypothetical protein B0I35DRAFT_481812 [Stachybotrys elegans]|uniref:F-box domain-containing protein n=1 Tax=Stachybotrys elegans TaxID=80388 RepID=A0A8K0SKR1_9HYPO|nr:hypothetical protein B0I35DRAFT_481812 [Stachybotrys elegans]